MNWYAQFEQYRLMGPGRSLLTAFQKAQKGTKRHSQPSGAWNRAAVEWRWQERAAVWDRAELARRREVDEALFRQALDRHRDTAIKLAQTNLNNAVRLLTLIDQRLQTIKVDELPVGLLPGALRAAAAVSEAALNAEAQALAVDELLRELNGNAEHHQAE